jgi:N-acetylgalactosamine-N,N'-diacetylbacillosaminyl-diphospho-undecaprenol 4-alpha-N-acetylgalactosaminyltransferase
MIEQHKKYKIALIGYRLSAGGSDRVMARLSVFFEKQGIEVHNLIVIDEVSYPFAGKLINLGLHKNQKNDVLNKYRRMMVLRSYLLQNKFDYIIDFRFRTKPLQELILAKLIYNTTAIFTIHSYLINHYMPDNSWLTRLMYNSSYANVAVTNQIKERIAIEHKLTNLVTIFNPIDIVEIETKKDEIIDLSYEFIIAIGQFENPIKQFDLLIEHYAKSNLPLQNIHLVILGDGDVSKLNNAILETNFHDKIHLLGYQENPFKFVSKAKFLVLSSQNEGLPNVILEALACQTPVVTFDCPSGPREIVNGKNGVLVENQNWQELILAMNKMIEDEVFYKSCKQNSLESCAPFLLDTIGRQWLDLMKIKYK